MVKQAFFLLFGLWIFGSLSFAQTPEKPISNPLKDSVSKYVKLVKYAKAVPFAEQWLAVVKKEKGDKSAEYGAVLNTLGDAINRSGNSKAAEPMLLEALEIRKKALGEEHPDLESSYQHIGVLYLLNGNYPAAGPYLFKTLEIRRKTVGEEHANTASSYNNIGLYYMKMGDFVGALPNYKKALEIRSKLYGEEHLEVAASYGNLALLHREMGNYDLAEPFYHKTLEIRLKKLGEDHPEVGMAYNNLGIFYHTKGNYHKSEEYFLKGYEIRKKALGEDHPDVGASTHNLAAFFDKIGKFPQAEVYYLKALDIQRKSQGEDNPNLAGYYINVGNFYDRIGDAQKAEEYYVKGFEIKKNAYGEMHFDLAFVYNNLASINKEKKNYKAAEEYFFKSINIRTKALGDSHIDLANSFNGLANLYFAQGSYAKAESMYLKTMAIKEKALGEWHPENTTLYENMGQFYKDKGEHQKSESMFLKNIKIYHDNFGDFHPDLGVSQLQMGLLYEKQGSWKKAAPYFLRAQENFQQQIIRFFPFLSSSEKEKFYSSIKYWLDAMVSSWMGHADSNPDLATYVFNQQLFSKALLLSSSQKFNQRLRNSKDTLISGSYGKWEGLTNRIAKMITSGDSAQLVKVAALEKEAEALEKELVRKSEDFAGLADKKQVTWKDIQKKLKPGEVAIEMVRFQKTGMSKSIIDTSDPAHPTYRLRGLTDTAHYAALIVRTNSIYPEWVLLKNGNDLEEKWIHYYKAKMVKRQADDQSYNQFWKKIGARLGPGVKKIYFSPDGVFHSINLNTLVNPKTRKYLFEERDIQLVTNTKDIITANLPTKSPLYACLVGSPDFNVDKTDREQILLRQRNRTREKTVYKLALTRNDALADLPGTKVEVDNISTLLKTKGWKVESLTGINALEETVKGSDNPRILHIATHGFFQHDTTQNSNPLLHSGLLLSGASKTMEGEKDDQLDDGILTAFEAMNLNLDNTDLVVLSACETGLGEIKNGEGVYGLQRAFKVAGAKSIIMSLWKVNDDATQELMVNFYKHWLGADAGGSERQPAPEQKAVWPKVPTAGSTKRAAFLQAQKELKAKYPNPYYWGAFVMVGE